MVSVCCFHDVTSSVLFRFDDWSVHAIGNVHPFSGVAVISRGIVDGRGGRATVKVPILEQALTLDDGSYLVGVRSFPCRSDRYM